MNKKWLLVAGFLAMVFTSAVYSGPGEQDWQSMTPEERSAAKEARRAEWESLSDEEKQVRREERRTRFESLSEEEKQEMRNRRQQRGAEGGGRGEHRQRGQRRRGSQ